MEQQGIKGGLKGNVFKTPTFISDREKTKRKLLCFPDDYMDEEEFKKMKEWNEGLIRCSEAIKRQELKENN